MKKINIDQQIKNTFHWINLSLDDFKKLLDADYLGRHGPNFSIAMVALAITEPIAKLYYPHINKQQEIRVYKRKGNRADIFDKIDAKLAAGKFFKKYFKNKRYGQLSDFIWDVFRNSHVHLFQCKKVVKVPLGEINNSFLTGIFFSSGLKTNSSIRQRQDIDERIHLKFELSYKNGIPRPIFVFVPYIYYFDLKEAVKKFKKDLENQAKELLRRRFSKASVLLGGAKRLDFTSGRLNNITRKILIRDIQECLKSTK